MTTTGPRATLTSSAPCFIRPRNVGVHQAPGLAGAAARSGSPRRRRAAGRAARRACARRRGRVRATRSTSTSKGSSRRSIATPDVAVPDDQHASCRPATGASPGATWSWSWSRDEPRDAAQRGQRQGQRELGGRGVVDAAAVAQQHARRGPGRGCGRRRRSASAPPRAAASAASSSPCSRAEVVRRHVELAPPPTEPGTSSRHRTHRLVAQPVGRTPEVLHVERDPHQRSVVGHPPTLGPGHVHLNVTPR